MAESSGGSYDGLMLKVTPETLQNTAQTVQNHISKLSSVFDSIGQLVSRSQGYWLGEAGDFHRSSFENRKEDIELVLKRLKEHPKDLLAMANVYSNAENEAQEMAAALPSDALM